MKRSWKIDPEVVATDLGNEEMALINLRDKRMYTLNPAGYCAWKMLEQGAGEAQIVERICRAFAASRSSARRDLAALLAHLADRELITRCLQGDGGQGPGNSEPLSQRPPNRPEPRRRKAKYKQNT
jgi:hypothetical protein